MKNLILIVFLVCSTAVAAKEYKCIKTRIERSRTMPISIIQALGYELRKCAYVVNEETLEGTWENCKYTIDQVQFINTKPYISAICAFTEKNVKYVKPEKN